jgi:DNA-binding GntR family transcriptional regulator
MTVSTKSGDLKKLKYLNYQFHDLMVMCSGNQRLIDTYFLLVKQIRWATTLCLELPDRPEQSLREHKAIFMSFKQKEPEKTRRWLEDHSSGNMKRILSVLKAREKTEPA